MLEFPDIYVEFELMEFCFTVENADEASKFNTIYITDNLIHFIDL